MTKPSKKIIALIILSLGIIGFILFNKFYKAEKSVSLTPVIESPTTTIDQNFNLPDTNSLDSDGDGLPDWQEIITGTDLNNKDTDSDGTDDGKELEVGRDPVIAGPNDKLEKTSVKNSISADGIDITTSEAVSQNLFANAVYLSNNDQVTEENVNTLVNNLVAGAQSTFTFKEYTASNLPIISNATKDNIRFFASNLATLQIKLLNDLANTQDMTALSKLYADYAQELYAIQTPADIVDIEIKFINNFSKVSAVYTAFANQAKDPLKLPLAVKAYQDAGNEQSTLIKTLGEFFYKNDIINSLDASAENYWTLVLEE